MRERNVTEAYIKNEPQSSNTEGTFLFHPVPSEFADVTRCNDDSTDKSALGEVWQL